MPPETAYWLAFGNSCALLALAGVATWHDVRSRRIPNAITLGGIALGLAFRAAAGMDPLHDGVTGAALGFAIGITLFATGVMGGGDGKFLMAAGAFLGISRFPGALLFIALIGGVIALIEALRRRALGTALANTGRLVTHLATFGLLGRPDRAAPHAAATVPYGAAIALGTVLWWFWGRPLA